jgi:hypothetical protein
MQKVLIHAASGVLAFGLIACDDEHDHHHDHTIDGTGSLTVLVDTETQVTEGIMPGDAPSNIKDGWAVQFGTYVVAVGEIDLDFHGTEEIASSVYAIDLVDLPSEGLALWSFADIGATRWDLRYHTKGAADGATRDESVDQAHFDAMVANDWTYYIEGEMTKADGQSCPPAGKATPGDAMPNGNESGGNPCYDAPSVRFELGAAAETVFGPCEIDGVPGVAVPKDGEQTAAVSIHGDHLFFNGFPEGDEGGVSRLAQWLADCDLNLDGVVTNEELQAISPSDLPEIDDRYQLGGSPITPVDNMYTYLRAQLKTQGHFQGEGGCAIDGTEVDHSGHNH